MSVNMSACGSFAIKVLAMLVWSKWKGEWEHNCVIGYYLQRSRVSTHSSTRLLPASVRTLTSK